MVRKKTIFAVSLSLVIGLSPAFWSASARAADAGRNLDDYFRGKTITVIVGSAPGGGHDINSRLWAKYGRKHIPGQPRMIVRNMPGGGGERALRATFTSKPDGLTMSNLHPRWPTLLLLGEKVNVPNFDLDTLTMLGSPVNVPVPRLICARSDVARTWEEVLALDKPLTFGAGEPGGTSMRPVEFLNLIWKKSPFHIVFGYGGISESMAAFDRGELAGLANCSERDVPRLFPEWVEQKRFTPLFWWDGPSDPEYLRKLGVSPNELRHFFDLPKVDLTKEQRTVFNAASALGRYTRAIVLPPGVPEDVLRALREAYRATMQDPEFIRSMEAAGYEVGFGDPKDFRETMAEARTLSPQGKDLFRKLLGIKD